MVPVWGKGKAPGLGRSNDGKQQVFLDPYRIYIDYADSDLSYDEVTEDGIRRREKGAGRAYQVTSPFHYAHACLEQKMQGDNHT